MNSVGWIVLFGWVHFVFETRIGERQLEVYLLGISWHGRLVARTSRGTGVSPVIQGRDAHATWYFDSAARLIVIHRSAKKRLASLVNALLRSKRRQCFELHSLQY